MGKMPWSADGSPWAWRLQRAWARGRLNWWAWGAGVSISVAAGVAAASWWQRAETRARDVEQQRSQVVREAPPAAPVRTQASDFARRLGPPPSASGVVHEIQRASAEARVRLVSLQAQERAPTIEQLGRLEMAVSLRGSYEGSKLVLKQVAERFPSLTVQRLRMLRGASPNEVETQATLSLWSAPLVISLEGR